MTTVRDGNSPVSVEEDEWVYGIYNESRRDLSIIFESANPAVGINVYKDGKDLVVSRLFAVNPKDTLSFSLAKHDSYIFHQHFLLDQAILLHFYT